MPRSTAWVAKRIATGLPLPSPTLNVDPLAVVTRRFPLRTSLSSASRSNRSIGRLLTRRRVGLVLAETPRPRHNWRPPALLQTDQSAVGRDRPPSRNEELKQSLICRATRMSCRELQMICRLGKVDGVGPHPLFGQKSQANAAAGGAPAGTEGHRVAVWSSDALGAGRGHRIDRRGGPCPVESRRREVRRADLRRNL